MEQHPVPQNVTTFQFRLIGDMTLKQFSYLCAGAILAFIAHKLPLPFIFTWPLTILFALLGVGFAFVPVEERPMDVWVFSFFKSIYSPTQYLWQREPPSPPPSPPVAASSLKRAGEGKPPTLPITAAPQQEPKTATPRLITSQERVATLFMPQPTTPLRPAPPQTTSAARVNRSVIDTFLALFQRKPKTPALSQSTPTPSPSPSVTGKRPLPEEKSPSSPLAPQTSKEDKGRIAQLESTLQQLERQLAAKTGGEMRVVELQKQLTQVLSEKEAIQKELVSLKRKLESAAKTPVGQPARPPQQTVKVITTPDLAVKAGLPRLTNVPNVVTGIIKDSEGNLLPGILVTILDQEGIPMRALKTNKLGQFAASTPLPNNTYVVEVEDPRSRFVFARVQITPNGLVMPALEIIAKSQKEVSREKLAQQIFENAQ